MWSPTTNQASDNKKSEVLEERRGSRAAVVKAGSSDNLQNQLNVFEHNSNKQQQQQQQQQQQKFGDSEAALKKEREFLSETVDSGFISGPQSSSNIFDDQGEDDESTNITDKEIQLPPHTTQKFNITATAPDHSLSFSTSAQQQQQQHKQYNKKQQEVQDEKIILDSGCIDDVADDEDYFAEDDKYEEHEQHIGAVAGNDKNQKHQVHCEQSNATVAATIGNSNNNNSAQMILKHDLDAGMSERFCNLSLQTGTTTTTTGHTQQQPQQVAGFGINNLNFSGRIQQQQQQQQSILRTPTQATTGSSATANEATPTKITPTNAWEQFYQQNDEGDTPLHLACISGDVDVVIALLRMAPHPCLFNIQNDIAQSPLHLAALTSQPKMLRMLLLAGAEPTIRDRHGNTALHIACIAGEEQCVKALTNKFGQSEINEAHRLFGHRTPDKMSILGYKNLPSDLEIRNYDGERCVHLTAQAGHIEILRILKDQGADINAREGKSGRTPLHIAIECCNEDLANFLLDECEKLNLETATYAGLTAYQVACILNKSQMQNILEKRGAEPLTPPDSDYSDSELETDLDDSKLYDRFGDPGYFINYNGTSPMTVV